MIKQGQCRIGAKGCKKPASLSITLTLLAIILLLSGCANNQASNPEKLVVSTPTPSPLSPEQKAAHEKQERLLREQAEVKRKMAEKRAKDEKVKRLKVEAIAAARERKEQLRSEGLIWNYDEKEYEMGDGKIKYATVHSLNDVEFGFPYQGSQKAVLGLRKHPKQGKNAYISIEKGQFICGVDSCSVSVKFDEGKAQAYSASQPSDYRTTSLFIEDYDRFYAKLKRAKKVRIEAEFYQEGSRVFEFDCSDLQF